MPNDIDKQIKKLTRAIMAATIVFGLLTIGNLILLSAGRADAYSGDGWRADQVTEALRLLERIADK